MFREVEFLDILELISHDKNIVSCDHDFMNPTDESDLLHVSCLHSMENLGKVW